MTGAEGGRATTRSVRCRGCGAEIPVPALAGEVTCVHCGHHQRLDPELLAELDAYQDRVDFRMAQAEQELQNAQDLTRFDDWGEEPEVSPGRKALVVLVGLGLASWSRPLRTPARRRPPRTSSPPPCWRCPCRCCSSPATTPS